MSQKKIFLKVLRHAIDAFFALESAGFDTDLLSGISDAHYPRIEEIRKHLSSRQIESLMDIERSLGPRPKVSKSEKT